MATNDKIKALKEALKEAKVAEKDLKGAKTQAEKDFIANTDKESFKVYLSAVKDWSKAILNVAKADGKLVSMMEAQSEEAA